MFDFFGFNKEKNSSINNTEEVNIQQKSESTQDNAIARDLSVDVIDNLEYGENMLFKYINRFGYKDFSELSFHNRRTINQNILSFNVYDYTKLLNEISIEKVHSFINRMLEDSVPVIDKYDGVIEKIFQAGFLAFFEKNASETLDAAIEIFDKIRNTNNLTGLDNYYYIGIVNGDITAGLVGTKDYKTVLTMSKSTMIAEEIQKFCYRFYSKILVSENFIKQIPNVENHYNIRFIGYVRKGLKDEYEKLYDVYDGDDAETRNLKRQTQKLFERGVSEYVAKNYYEARNNFIEVLRNNKDDRAAMEYVKACDYCRENNISEINIL